MGKRVISIAFFLTWGMGNLLHAQGDLTPSHLTLKQILNKQKTQPIDKNKALTTSQQHLKRIPFNAQHPNALKGQNLNQKSTYADVRKTIEAKIEQELQNTYGELLTIKAHTWHPPQGYEQQYLVEEIQIEADHSRFIATVTFFGQNAHKTLKIRGIIDQLVTIPGLNRPIPFGEVIQSEDITQIKIPSKRIGHTLITKAKDLIGTSPRRGFLKVNTPVTFYEVMKPQEVSKGDNVTVLFNTDKIHLTMKGRALDTGANGEIVRILNISSNKIIDAQVTGPKMVTVSPMT